MRRLSADGRPPWEGTTSRSPSASATATLSSSSPSRKAQGAPVRPGDILGRILSRDKRLNQISATLSGGQSSIYLYRLGEFGEDPPDIRNPAELRFDPYYGKIKSHHWAGAGYLVVCFDSGQCVLCRMEGGEMEQELCNYALHGCRGMAMKTRLRDIGRLAFSGPTVKMIDVSNGDLTENTSDALEFSVKCEVTCLGWSMEGQVLTSRPAMGSCTRFSRRSNLCRAFGDRCAYLPRFSKLPWWMSP